MLIIITPEQENLSEIQNINKMFENGLKTLHLRKPTFSVHELEAYLLQIDKKYHQFVVVHAHHQLAIQYHLKGIHLTEKKRKSLALKAQQYVNNYQKKGYTVSSSFHKLSDLQKCEFGFNTPFLSPVFTSISKTNYQGKHFKVANCKQKIIALGGIVANNIGKAKQLGYEGVAVLGGVWKTDNPVARFIEIKEKYNQIYK